jgi:hypothetical protein
MKLNGQDLAELKPKVLAGQGRLMGHGHTQPHIHKHLSQAKS